MSEENVEAYKRGLDAFNRRDKAAWLAACDPKVENVPPRDWPESDPIRGFDAVWDFFVENQEPWEESPYEFELIEVGNNKIVTHVRAQMRGKASGAGVAWSMWNVVTFRNGKVLRFEWFADRAEALEAAGLSE